MTENERIKELRKQKGMTQSEFSFKIGVTKSAISNIESGVRGVSEQTRLLICREFGVSIDWLRDGVGEMETARSRRDDLAEQIDRFMTTGTDSFKRRLVDLLLRLDESQWEALEKYARQLLAHEQAEASSFPETREQLHADLDLQLDAQEKKAGVESSASPPTKLA